VKTSETKVKAATIEEVTDLIYVPVTSLERTVADSSQEDKSFNAPSVLTSSAKGTNA
jgi:hypothetical protein